MACLVYVGFVVSISCYLNRVCNLIVMNSRVSTTTSRVPERLIFRAKQTRGGGSVILGKGNIERAVTTTRRRRRESYSLCQSSPERIRTQVSGNLKRRASSNFRRKQIPPLPI